MQELMVLIWLALLMNPAGSQLTDLVDSTSYWESQGVEYTLTAMLEELKPPVSAPRTQVEDAIRQLGAVRHADREAAETRLREGGSGVRPYLESVRDSDDPEVRLRVRRLLKTLAGTSQMQTARRIMAIRGLGEFKSPEAIPALKSLANGPSAAESREAGEALRRLNGEPPGKPESTQSPRLATQHALARLPSRVDIAGLLHVPQRTCPTPLSQRFAQQGFLVDMAGQERMMKSLRQGAAKLLNEVGNVKVHGVAFAVDGSMWPHRKIAAVVAGEFDLPRLRQALENHSTQTRTQGSRRWHQIRADIHVALDEDGFLRADFSSPFDLTWWKDCPQSAEGGIPRCWPPALQEAATGPARGTNSFWLVTGGEKGRIWRNRPALAPIRAVVVEGFPVGTNTAWRFQMDLPCADAQAAEGLHAFAKEKVVNLRKGATAAAVNLTAIRPLAALLDSLELLAPAPHLRVSALLQDPDQTLLALPFLLMLQAGFGF